MEVKSRLSEKVLAGSHVTWICESTFAAVVEAYQNENPTEA